MQQDVSRSPSPLPSDLTLHHVVTNWQLCSQNRQPQIWWSKPQCQSSILDLKCSDAKYTYVSPNYVQLMTSSYKTSYKSITQFQMAQANQATPAFSIVAEPWSPLASNRDFMKLGFSKQLLTIYEEQSEPSSWQRILTLMWPSRFLGWTSTHWQPAWGLCVSLHDQRLLPWANTTIQTFSRRLFSCRCIQLKVTYVGGTVIAY